MVPGRGAQQPIHIIGLRASATNFLPVVYRSFPAICRTGNIRSAYFRHSLLLNAQYGSESTVIQMPSAPLTGINPAWARFSIYLTGYSWATVHTCEKGCILSKPRSDGEEGGRSRTVARLLQKTDGTGLFIYLALEAVDGNWKSFAAALSEVSELTENGVEVMLEKPEPSVFWAHAYTAAGLPASLYKFFLQLISVSQKAVQRDPSSRRREILIEAKTLSETATAPVPQAFWSSLSGQ